MTWTYGDIQVPDTSGDCGNDWATDAYDTAMEVTPQANGSYLVSKYLSGSFVTIAGDAPNAKAGGGTCGVNALKDGINGTFQGIETWTVGTGPTNFDPTAVCASCSKATSSEQQNADFMATYFPGATYSGPQNYDFMYRTSTSSGCTPTPPTTTPAPAPADLAHPRRDPEPAPGRGRARCCSGALTALVALTRRAGPGASRWRSCGAPWGTRTRTPRAARSRACRRSRSTAHCRRSGRRA